MDSEILRDDWEPSLPEPDANGNYPALAAVRIQLARKLLKRRRKLGLSQRELAKKARVRLETLNRIEQGVISANERIMEKIEQVLEVLE